MNVTGPTSNMKTCTLRKVFTFKLVNQKWLVIIGNIINIFKVLNGTKAQKYLIAEDG